MKTLSNSVVLFAAGGLVPVLLWFPIVFAQGEPTPQRIDLDRIASLALSEQTRELNQLLATPSGRSAALAQLDQIATRLPNACEALVMREVLPVELLTELWLGIHEKRFSVPTRLEFAAAQPQWALKTRSEVAFDIHCEKLGR